MRAVAGKEPGERTSTKAAENLDDCVPEMVERRDSGRAKRRTTIGFGAEASLHAVEPSHSGRAHDGDRHDPVCDAPVPWARRRIEHIGQTSPQAAGAQPAEDFQEEMLGPLLLSLAERKGPSGKGTNSSTSSKT